MGKITPSEDGKKFPLTINPTSANNEITLLTRRKCVTKDIIINYTVPKYSSNYYNMWNINNRLSIGSYDYDNTTYFVKWQWNRNTISYTFNASSLPLYKWYNGDFNLQYSSPAYSIAHNYSLSGSPIFSSGNDYYEYIKSDGSQKTKGYKGKSIYYNTSSNSEYVYKGTVPDVNSTFRIKENSDGSGSTYKKRIVALCYGDSTNENAWTQICSEFTTSGPNGTPSYIYYYVKTEMYGIDTNNFNSWSDMGVYIIPKYDPDGSSKCYLQIFNHNSPTSDYYKSEKEINRGEAIILMPNPDTSSEYKWYYRSATNEYQYGTCKRFVIKWNNSNICPYVIKINA